MLAQAASATNVKPASHHRSLTQADGDESADQTKVTIDEEVIGDGDGDLEEPEEDARDMDAVEEMGEIIEEKKVDCGNFELEYSCRRTGGDYDCGSTIYNYCYDTGPYYCCSGERKGPSPVSCFGTTESSCSRVDGLYDCSGGVYYTCSVKRDGDYCCSSEVETGCPGGYAEESSCSLENGDGYSYVCGSTKYKNCLLGTIPKYCCEGEVRSDPEKEEEEEEIEQVEEEVILQGPDLRSNGLDIPAAPPLPPPPPYDPEISPQVDIKVAAQLPGDVPCNDLSGKQLQDLAVNYCLKILELADLGDAFFADQCKASCGSSRRRKMLQVNPVLFDIDFVRANEDPAAVDAVNEEAQELESFFLDDGLLDAALEQTLPGSTVTNQNVNVDTADPYSQSGAAVPEQTTPGTSGISEEDIPVVPDNPSGSKRIETTAVVPGTRTEGDCTEVPTPGDYTCEQQREWGKCASDFIIAGGYCAITCGRC